MTNLPSRLMDNLHAEALAEHASRQPYCTGDRCKDCTAPTTKNPDDECCEATCGCCPRVNEHGNCFLYAGSEEDSKYCDQHGEGTLFDRSPEAQRRYELLRGA
ncbi:hypothetical protein P1P75_40490 [Streptomyces sp. ID05-39B]|uniref:hypothetical protein n=1 Tax=Streptomyces sp. ID05-39B TaxID=3028664 RepID=UPI0029BB5271|nr:hypothetical protein [Streptomyces sp. ID05-39B]MDX3532511.1 hypothetical protein [Streptomyces sp. ID05-39B]